MGVVREMFDLEQRAIEMNAEIHSQNELIDKLMDNEYNLKQSLLKERSEKKEAERSTDNWKRYSDSLRLRAGVLMGLLIAGLVLAGVYITFRMITG